MLTPTPGLPLDLGLEGVGPGGSAVERDGGHAHDQIVRRGGHHATDRLQHVSPNELGAGGEGLVADRLRVGREDAAVMVGDAGRPHHFENLAARWYWSRDPARQTCVASRAHPHLRTAPVAVTGCSFAEGPASVRSIDVRRQVSASVLPVVVGRSACKRRPIVKAESPLIFGAWHRAVMLSPFGRAAFPPEC